MSSEPAENSSLHSLITGIFNALSHEIRSPLSVISNETSCFEASIGTDAIKKSVKEIVDIIDLANAYQNEEDVSFSSVQELCDALGNGVTLAPNLPLNSPLNLKEKKSLIYALQQTLKQISSPSRTTISIESNHLALRVACRSNGTRRNPSSFLLPQFLLNQNTSPLTLMLAELILKIHGATITPSEDAVLITLTLCAQPPP